MDQLTYHAYTSCIILTYGLATIDPALSSVWIRSDSGCLVISLNTVMAGEFDPEAFKVQLKEELLAENRLMMRKMMREIIKLIKENQPIPPIGPVDLDIELLIREREEDKVTVLASPIG